jgi:hypothetical protein
MNRNGSRHHRIKSDYGIADYYKFYRSIGGKLTSKEFNKVIRDFHYEIGSILLDREYSFKISSRLGVLTITKVKTYIKYDPVSKSLKTNLPPNWKETNKLWEEDPEAKANKTIVRLENQHTNKFKYKFLYKKNSANYPNKTLYKFRANRQLKQRLKGLLFQAGEIERSLAYEYN